MRTTAIFNVVYNRIKKELQANDKGLIQIEIFFIDGKKKYVGISHVTQSEWDHKKREVTNTPIASRLNNEIQDTIHKLRNHELKLIEDGYRLTASDVDSLLNPTKKHYQSFIQFMRTEINKRNDIHVKTRSRHLLMATTLENLGIIRFSDLTFANIMKLDQHMKNKGTEQTTIHKKHQFVNVYIHLAEKFGIFDYAKNPYRNFENKRGTSRMRIRLDDSEIEKICNKKIFEKNLQFCRDIYVFQIYTGLSYTDLQSITYSANVSYQDDGTWITGLRRKDKEIYSIPVIKEAESIMKKYRETGRDLVFSTPTIKTQNDNLKLVASICEINKHLTTHTARHTGATLMLRKGVPIEYISRILGHSSIETTLLYSKIEKVGIRKYMTNLSGK